MTFYPSFVPRLSSFLLSTTTHPLLPSTAYLTPRQGHHTLSTLRTRSSSLTRTIVRSDLPEEARPNVLIRQNRMTDLSHYTFGPSRRPSSSFLSSSSSSPAHSPLTITSNGGRRHSAGGPVHTTSHTRTNHISTAPSTRRNSASSTSSSSSSSPSTQDRANLRQRRRSSAHSLRERRRRYELTVVQQPQRGLALGSSINTLNRVPLSPIPVVQLTAREEGGERPPSPSETRYLFCSCALVPPDTELGGTVDYVAGGEGQTALVGQLVSSVKHVVALNGQPVAYFGACGSCCHSLRRD